MLSKTIQGLELVYRSLRKAKVLRAVEVASATQELVHAWTSSLSDKCQYLTLVGDIVNELCCDL